MTRTAVLSSLSEWSTARRSRDIAERQPRGSREAAGEAAERHAEEAALLPETRRAAQGGQDPVLRVCELIVDSSPFGNSFMNRIQFSASGAKYEALEVGVLTPGVVAV